jgi:prepilin-type processing-associated H-X9-DG protein
MSMNAFLCPGGSPTSVSEQDMGNTTTPNKEIKYFKDSDLIQPGSASLWLLMDENPFSINDGFLVINANEKGWVDYPATYHNGSGGVAYCDGHAILRKWTDPLLLNDRSSAGNGTGQVTAFTPGNGDFNTISMESTFW